MGREEVPRDGGRNRGASRGLVGRGEVERDGGEDALGGGGRQKALWDGTHRVGLKHNN